MRWVIFSTTILFSIFAYLLVENSGVIKGLSFLSLLPAALALVMFPVQKLFVVLARVILPISYGLFATGIFCVGFDSIANSEFYNIARFGIQGGEQVISFEADDNFFNSVTVLFSICSAFLLWKGLTDFDRLKEVLNTEAETIWAIAFLTTYLREGDEDGSRHLSGIDTIENQQNIEATNEICAEFQAYFNRAIGKEGEHQDNPSVDVLRSNDDLIDKCVSATKKIVVKENDENDRIALQEIMKNLSLLVSIRSKRRVYMETSMPPYILGIILFMSLALLVPFFSNGSEIMSVNHLYVFLLSSIHMFIFMTLVDLSSPFVGYFSIQLEAYKNAKQRIDQLVKLRKESGDIDAVPDM